MHQSKRHQSENLGPAPSVTCYLRYVVEPSRLPDFEQYARFWMDWVNQAGGQHHGYFLPSEGANNIALALFSFPSLALYEAYRQASSRDQDCLKAYQEAEDSGCIVSYERSFFRSIFSEAANARPA